VVWEPVLVTDWAQPSNRVLRRIYDSRALQFWDKERLVSHAMGEHDRKSVVWDRIAVYASGALWTDQPPLASYSGGPVVRVTDAARDAVTSALQKGQNR
jgi:hypothetical protein